MPKAVSISLSRFTTSVQSAVKAAVAKHPKFKGTDGPQDITISWLIWGYPPPDAALASATLSETQAFVNDVAAHIGGAHPEAFSHPNPGPEGAVLSIGRHVICGIPPVTHLVVKE